jgi:hypothetical protein
MGVEEAAIRSLLNSMVFKGFRAFRGQADLHGSIIHGSSRYRKVRDHRAKVASRALWGELDEVPIRPVQPLSCRPILAVHRSTGAPLGVAGVGTERSGGTAILHGED